VQDPVLRVTSELIKMVQYTKKYKSWQVSKGVQRLFPHLVRDSNGKMSNHIADMFPK
jgi:hypothetical protein